MKSSIKTPPPQPLVIAAAGCPLLEAVLALICRSCLVRRGSAGVERGPKDHLPVPHVSLHPPAFDGILLSASKDLRSESTAGPEPVPVGYVVMPPVATGSLAPSKPRSSFMVRSLLTPLPSSPSFNPQAPQQVKGTWQIWGQGARRVRKTSLSGPRIFSPPLPTPSSPPTFINSHHLVCVNVVASV